MKESTLDTAIAEAKRFLEKAEKLKEATEAGRDEEFNFHRLFGHDCGLNTKNSGMSKTRAAVKRACIDLKNALSDVTQGR